MLEALTKHLSNEAPVCVVAKWINSLKYEEQQAFIAVKENNARIKVASLYSDLNKEDELPFKITAFRSHIRGYCTCQN
jgi:hypothetical protein